MIRTKYFAISWGYHIQTDLPFSLTVAIGHRKPENGGYRYRSIFQCYCDWPKFHWVNETWAMNEPGYLQGMPIARRGVPSSLWTGRPWSMRFAGWYRGWSFTRYV